MFNVLEFDDGLAVVPSLWLIDNNKLCKWPPYNSEKKIVNAQIKNEVPSTNWPVYEVIKLHGNAENYEKANKLLVDAKEHSDIDSFMKDKDEYKKTRKNRAKKMSSNSSSSESENSNNVTGVTETLRKPPTLKIISDEIINPTLYVNDTYSKNMYSKENNSNSDNLFIRSAVSDADLSSYKDNTEKNIEENDTLLKIKSKPNMVSNHEKKQINEIIESTGKVSHTIQSQILDTSENEIIGMWFGKKFSSNDSYNN